MCIKWFIYGSSLPSVPHLNLLTLTESFICWLLYVSFLRQLISPCIEGTVLKSMEEPSSVPQFQSQDPLVMGPLACPELCFAETVYERLRIC